MPRTNEPFDLQEYLTKGVEDIVRDAVRATLKDPRESAFMLKFAAASKAASRRRRELEDKGEHVPSFLIASITSKCNLHCAGCYSRCNHATVDAGRTGRQLQPSRGRRTDAAPGHHRSSREKAERPVPHLYERHVHG